MDAKLCAKDEEVEKLIVERTQGLEQRHREALNAQAQVHVDKMKELEVERDGLKNQVMRCPRRRTRSTAL